MCGPRAAEGESRCFHCGGLGHMAYECSAPQLTVKPSGSAPGAQEGKAGAEARAGSAADAAAAKPKKPCHKFALGQCMRGDDCRFSHALPCA